MIVPSASVTAAWKVTPCALKPARFRRTRWFGSNDTAKSFHRYCPSLPVQRARRIRSKSPLRDQRETRSTAFASYLRSPSESQRVNELYASIDTVYPRKARAYLRVLEAASPLR